MFSVIHPLDTMASCHPREKERRYIVKCRCGFTAAFNAANSNIRTVSGHGTDALVTDQGAIELRNGVARCTCRRELRINRVKARITEHVCSAICRNAKGPNCDCSCGGQHHGAGFPLVIL